MKPSKNDDQAALFLQDFSKLWNVNADTAYREAVLIFLPKLADEHA